jgi:hypothetical protein
MPASRACWTAETMDGRVGRGQQDALGAIGDAGLDGRDLGLVVAVDLAGIGLEFDAEFAALASAPSRIFTKNGLVSVLVIRQAPFLEGRVGSGRTQCVRPNLPKGNTNNAGLSITKSD